LARQPSQAHRQRHGLKRVNLVDAASADPVQHRAPQVAQPGGEAFGIAG
jgi:hypothetical protein